MGSQLQKIYRNTAVSSTALLVETGSNLLVGWNLININTTNCFLKVYNAAAAVDVTVGTTTPLETLLIPASGCHILSNEDMFQIGCSLGMVIAVTTGMLDNSSAAPSTACYVKLLYSDRQ